jgi:hypothetical protein
MKDMPVEVRRTLGYLLQDAFNYFLQAGGKGLEHRYTESQFSTESGGRRLSSRLEALSQGKDKLLEITTLIRPYVKKGEYLWPHNLEQIHEAETMEQVETAARLGLKMVISIGKNFGVDPYVGYTLERMVEDEPDPKYRKPVWAWKK